jgi:hypothetical protein
MGVPSSSDESDDKKPNEAQSNGAALVSWVIARVKHGRDQRDEKHGRRWEEYTRLWRGFYTSLDANNDSERSRLIAPALQQAIEMTTAEIEEAIFGKEMWFDVEDDNADKDSADVIQAQSNLLDDFDTMAVEDNISKCVLLGCIYGTGIAKLNVVKHVELVFDAKTRKPVMSRSIKVAVEAIRPDEFVIDPSATNVDDALFCAHEIVKPKHTIVEKQNSGVYRKGPISTFNGKKTGDPTGTGSTSSFTPQDDAVFITEYYGKVPTRFLVGQPANMQDQTLVEAIITIANETTLLKAVKNPYVMGDRPIVAYQHDTVPGEFWGRGVSEKGYNPQKALDAELRARIDALALMTAPMMGADLTRLPRNPELAVRPGKTIFTRGRPSEVYEPVAFGNPAQLGATFQHTGDLERMVQMGTGSMDSMTPTGIARRNETAGGMSMMLAGALKRTKRTMQNIERQFLNPLVRKSMWRYLQFDPMRYGNDYVFEVKSTMGIMAKEVENQQLVQMLGFTPPESPAHAIILKALFDNTASADKKALKDSIDALMAPPSPEQQQMQQMMQQLQLRAAQADTMQKEAEAALSKAQADLAQAKTAHEYIKADLADDVVHIQAANAATSAEQARVSRAQVQVSAAKVASDHHIGSTRNAVEHHSNMMQGHIDHHANVLGAQVDHAGNVMQAQVGMKQAQAAAQKKETSAQ